MPFKAGQSGNSNGRPRKGEALNDQLLKALSERMTYKGKTVQAKEIICKRLVHEAIAGDVLAIKLIYERLLGKPYQSIDVTSQGKALQIPPINMTITSTTAEGAVQRIINGDIAPDEPSNDASL